MCAFSFFPFLFVFSLESIFLLLYLSFSFLIKFFLTRCNVSVPIKSNFTVCSACCLGKAHRLPSHTSTTIYTRPLELVYIDLWGPASTVSSCGYLYFLSIIDASSKYTWIYPIKYNSDTYSTSVQFKTMIELQLDLQINAV